MNTGAGKGPVVRKGLDINRYQENRAKIDFSKGKKLKPKKVIKRKGVTTYVY